MANDPFVPRSQLTADAFVGVAACAAVWWRKRWPVALSVLLSVACTFYVSPSGAGLVGLYTLAVHRSFRVVVAVGIPALLSSPVALLRQGAPLPVVMSWTLTGVGLICAALGWGMFVRSRHQVVLSLRDRAQRAEVEAGLRAEQARQRTREEVAREMHDVLAHRLSLLSVHAGALEFRSDASREEVGQAAKVIQESAHQALEDLREVIGVLRAPEGDGCAEGRLQSNLTDLSGWWRSHGRRRRM
jgi:signal transduction histidine kinase